MEAFSVTPALLERESELALLSSLLEALRADRSGGVVLVDGPPGIGKTALLHAALETAAAAGLTVLRARGSELEAQLAFGGVRQLFAAQVLALTEAERNAVLAGPARLAGPVLGLPPAADSRPTLGDPLYGLYWLAVELSERSPLVLAVDDLHWLDDESGRFAAYLAERTDGVAVVLLATARPDEPGAARGPLAVVRERATVIRPGPLGEASVARLLHQPAAAAALRATGGNPLFVTELRRALDAAPATPVEDLGPTSIARLVLARVERISPDAVTLARAIALFPEGASLADAASLSSLDEDASAEAADALIAAEVLADGEPLRFLHPVMRRAIYDELGGFARRRGHARAAALLKQRAAPADAIAAHLLAGVPAGDPQDMRILIAAADEAESRRALAAAARYLERALAEDVGEPGERAVLRGRLGRLQAVLGRPEALESLRLAVAETTDVPARLDLGILLGKVAQANDPSTAIGELLALRAAAELDPQRALAIDAIIASSAAHRDPRVFGAAIARLPRDLPGDTEHERLALCILAFDAFRRNEPAAVVRELTLRSVGETGAVELDVGTDADDSVYLLAHCGAIEEAEAFAQERMDRARETGAQAAYAAAQSVLAEAVLVRGDLIGTEAAIRLGLAARPVPTIERVLKTRLHHVLVAQGRLDEAASVAIELARLGGAYQDLRIAAEAMGRGDGAAAIAAFERLRGVTREHGYVNAAFRSWEIDHARALAAAGRPDEALAILRDYLTAAERFDEARVLGIAHLGLGRQLGGTTAREHLEHAHALLDESPYRYEAAKARLLLGARLRRDNERAAARELMLPALDYAERQRVAPLAAELREELKLVGSRPRTALLTGVAALTPSEDRIARLAAGGMANKQIAQHLFLTVKTVESHLASTYRKLDINSRRDLPEALGEVGAPAA